MAMCFVWEQNIWFSLFIVDFEWLHFLSDVFNLLELILCNIAFNERYLHIFI